MGMGPQGPDPALSAPDCLAFAFCSGAWVLVDGEGATMKPPAKLFHLRLVQSVARER